MFRKHFRIRRLVLGLAFAAFAAPAAQASTGYLVDGGPVPVSRATAGSQQSYLRYHQVGGPLAAPAKVTTPLQADGMRLQAIANAYETQQATNAISERSYGVPGPDPSLVSQVVSSTSRGFDWRDAGVGASSAFGIALLLLIAVALGRRNQHAGLSNA
jgi:hypothetical protein